MTELRCRYRLYIDESGDHTFNLLDDPSHRFLGLLGVWFLQKDDYVAFVDQMEAFKKSIFGPRPDKPVVLHRSDIINRKGPFGLLTNNSVHKQFDDGLLSLIQEAKFRMVCVVIDKKNHHERYSSPFHPYHYCLAALLERYCGRLKDINAVGDVLAESRGKEEDLQLKQAYKHVFESGTWYFGRDHFQQTLTSKEIKIQAKSMNIAGLQLADILAYPIKQGMLIEKGLLGEARGTFGEQVRTISQTHFNWRTMNHQISGYGKVWL